MGTLKEDEALYLLAKERYYEENPATGLVEPIMTDAQFDILEDSLKNRGSLVIKQVGSTKGGKVPHLSPMLSLGKVNILDEDESFTEVFNELVKWATKIFAAGAKWIEASGKFDGNAMDLAYKDGKMSSATKRSDSKYGFDILDKMIHIAPLTIPMKETVEVRGEVVMKLDRFINHYQKIPNADGSFPKNARNSAAGFLTRDAIGLSVLKDLVFVAYEIRIHKDGSYFYPTKMDTMELLTKLGFNIEYPVYTVKLTTFNFQTFTQLYKDFLNYRENVSPFQLDGFVLKAEESARLKLGTNDHDPNWAIAVKFPPKDEITEILSLEWNTSGTGEVVPKAILQPIDLDGSKVTKAGLFNMGRVIEWGAWPGAKALVAKGGDIIPNIYKITTKASVVGTIPTHCSSCGDQLFVDGIHLYCLNEDDCPAQISNKLEASVRTFGMKGIGSSKIQDLYDAGIKTIEDYFDPTKFNATFLTSTGYFKYGRDLEKILEAVDSIKSIELWKVIQSIKISGLGESICKQVAKMMSGVPYDYTSLEKAPLEAITDKNGPLYKRLMEFLIILKNAGITVIMEKDRSKMFTYELTGAPPKVGRYKVKEDYMQLFETHGYLYNEKFNEKTSYLIIEDEKWTSGKTKHAKDLQDKGSNIKVVTYKEFIENILNLKDFFVETQSSITTKQTTPNKSTTQSLF